MSSYISKQQNPPPEVADLAPKPASVNGNQLVENVLLKRQVAELERHVNALSGGERKARADLLTAMSAAVESAKEQARLQEELTTREARVNGIVARDSSLQSEITDLRTKLRELEKLHLAAETRAARLPALDGSLVEVERKFAKLANYVVQRARIFGFLAEQMRQRRRHLISLWAYLDNDARGRNETLMSQVKSGVARERAAIDAALAFRRRSAGIENEIRAERLRNWSTQARGVRGAPTRRNRLAKLLEKVFSRVGSLGIAWALRCSGLWNDQFTVNQHQSAHRNTLLGYARGGGTVQTHPKALFDQRYYLQNNPSVASIKRPALMHYLVYGDRENRSPHPLVDVAYYRSANAHELGVTGLTVLQHFLFVGAVKGLNPHPLFDVRYYVSQLSDPVDLEINPLVHYLRTGWRRGLNPHPLFDNDRYLARNPDVAEMMIAPLLHYVTLGAHEGRDPHSLFFGQWYQTAYPDVLRSNQNPLAHFLDRGLIERRNPNPFFDSDYYLQQVPDAYATVMDPLQHYLQVGSLLAISPSREFDCFAFFAAHPDALSSQASPLEAWIEAGRPPTPSLEKMSDAEEMLEKHRPILSLLFDPLFYARQAQHLLSDEKDLLHHYLTTGWRLGLNPHRLFDTAWYMAHYPSALQSGMPPLLYFAISGAHDLQDPHPLFDSLWYVENYPDVRSAGEIPLVHYLRFGARENRSPGPLFDANAYLQAYPDVAAAGDDALAHFLDRWPLDNRSHGFSSVSAECPRGVDHAEWVAGLADSLARSADEKTR